LIRADGLADLHRHLDGSLRDATLHELAAASGIAVPPAYRFHARMGLDDALACFRLTVGVLQSSTALRRVASEICDDAAGDGVTTLEIRFAPHLHGIAIADAIDAVIDGAGGRAGVILCALYGDPPALVDDFVSLAGSRPGVVGIDLAGAPAAAHAHRLADYGPAFRRAAALGIGRTVHAAEGRSPDEIRVAIEALDAQRIGHGTTLLDDPSVLELVLARGVAIEACPTSNVHTATIASVDHHPLPRWLALGVRACINTDNTLLSDVRSSDEHARARAIPGMTDDLLARAIANGHAAAFRR
jgi:adenosine deaminase